VTARFKTPRSPGEVAGAETRLGRWDASRGFMSFLAQSSSLSPGIFFYFFVDFSFCICLCSKRITAGTRPRGRPRLITLGRKPMEGAVPSPAKNIMGKDLAKALAKAITEEFAEPLGMRSARLMYQSGITVDKFRNMKDDMLLPDEQRVNTEGYLRDFESGRLK